MLNIRARSAWLGLLALAAAIVLTAGFAGHAAARHGVHIADFHRLNARAQYVQSVPAQEGGGSVAMRCNEGAKSRLRREVG
jgi:hypothetical protein